MTRRENPERMPPGRQPYDPLVGLRVGALAGGIVGIVLLAVLGAAQFWVVLVAAVVGGAVGYLWEKRRFDAAASELPPERRN